MQGRDSTVPILTCLSAVMPPTDRQASIKEGDRLFGTECAACHGASGHNPTDGGRWMYPRAADLTSRDVQSYSDREVFWIIQNGIRLSGMPAVGRVETDEHIWDLVFYIHTLPKAASEGRQQSLRAGRRRGGVQVASAPAKSRKSF